MGLWGKITKTATKTFKKANAPVTAVAKRLEKAARPVSRPVRDWTKRAVKGTPIEATVRAATDWDIRKPHKSGLKVGHGVGSIVAAYWTGGASLEITKHIDKKIYGKDVGTLSWSDLKNAKQWAGQASTAFEKFQEQGGVEGLKKLGSQSIEDWKQQGAKELTALRDDVARGDFNAARDRMNGLRSRADSLIDQASGAVSDVRETLDATMLRREGPSETARDAAKSANRLAGDASDMPIAASVLSAFGMPTDRQQAAQLAPRGHNQLAFIALAGAAAFILLRK